MVGSLVMINIFIVNKIVKKAIYTYCFEVLGLTLLEKYIEKVVK